MAEENKKQEEKLNKEQIKAEKDKSKETKEKDKKENIVLIKREYIIPLRKEWLKVPVYKRANKAVKAIKEFMVRHMKVYDRDLRNIKIDILLNNELRFKGIRHPPAKIKVLAIKNSEGTVDVKLAEIPKYVEYQIARNAKKEAERAEKLSGKTTEKKKEIEEETKAKVEEEGKEHKEDEEKKAEKEKETASKEAILKDEKMKAKQAKHISKTRRETPIIFRKSLQK